MGEEEQASAVTADGCHGPWNTPTAHPVPAVGTSPTPSAPLAAARARAGELGNVRLLTHHGHGHIALFDTSGWVRAHESRRLVDGTLPPPGATCERDTPPLGPPGPTGGVTIGGGGAVRQTPPPERHGGPGTGVVRRRAAVRPRAGSPRRGVARHSG
ncbi:alpha/beta hydrolase [Streptomyces atrovirens]|uniref:Alpha/beta hydrolase n=1 Tax=Streptomyces atrovirens TaxID=285556 RepID=A0ABW0DRD0_9ACTN